MTEYINKLSNQCKLKKLLSASALAIALIGPAHANVELNLKKSFKADFCTAPAKAKLNTEAINFEKILEIEPLTPGFAILEGPIWIDDALVMSHIGYPTSEAPNPSDLVAWKDGKFSVIEAAFGANGLAYDADGYVVAARHLDGTVSRINGKKIVSKYKNARFNSPNDLIFSSKGDLYFTDPNWQTPDIDPNTEGRQSPQEAERAYHVAQNGDIKAFGKNIDKPNGVMLDQNERSLYVGGTNGLFKFRLKKDGSVIDKAKKIKGIKGGVDGMSKDCSGNLYVTSDGHVIILSKKDKVLAEYEVPGVTNVAFGGPEGKTIYATTLGGKPQVFSAQSNVAGYPF